MFEARQLVPQCDVLGDQVGPVLEDGEDKRDDQRELERHSRDGSLGKAEAGNDELHPRTQ